MNDDFDINVFKSTVINKIVDNKEIIWNLDKECIDAGGKLLYNKLFPFMQNPKTRETTSPFICFKVDHVKDANYFLEEINVIIYVVCHEKEMIKKVQSYKDKKYISGTVIDVIGEELKKSLSGLDTGWIGKLLCKSNTEEVLYYEYPCRVLKFSAMKETYGHN